MVLECEGPHQIRTTFAARAAGRARTRALTATEAKQDVRARARREMLKSRYYDARRAESTEHTYGSYETCNVDSDRSTHLSLNIYIPCNVIFITDIKMTNRRRKE